MKFSPVIAIAVIASLAMVDAAPTLSRRAPINSRDVLINDKHSLGL
jgi:hypothetical protein